LDSKRSHPHLYYIGRSFSPPAGNIDVLQTAPAFYKTLQDDIKKAKSGDQTRDLFLEIDELGKEFLMPLVESAKRTVVVPV